MGDEWNKNRPTTKEETSLNKVIYVTRSFNKNPYRGTQQQISSKTNIPLRLLRQNLSNVDTEKDNRVILFIDLNFRVIKSGIR